MRMSIKPGLLTSDTFFWWSIPGWVEGGLLLHDNHTDGCHSWDPAHHHHQVIGLANACHLCCTTDEMTNHLFRPGLANTDEELHHREGRNTTTTDTLLDLLTNCFPPNLVQVVFFFSFSTPSTHQFGPVSKSWRTDNQAIEPNTKTITDKINQKRNRQQQHKNNNWSVLGVTTTTLQHFLQNFPQNILSVIDAKKLSRQQCSSTKPSSSTPAMLP